MDKARLGTIAGLIMLAGAAGMVAPAAAVRAKPVQPAVSAAAPSALPARDEGNQVRQGRPIVMLVCREVRSRRQGEAPRSADLACVTRWAGF